MSVNPAFDPDEKVKKALSVFWKKGYRGTSADDLVKATGMNQASLDNFFGNKHELFIATLKLYLKELKQRYYQFFSNPSPAIDIINQIIDMVVEITIKMDISYWGAKHPFEPEEGDKMASELVEKSDQEILAYLTLLFVKAQEEGAVEFYRNPTFLANCIFSSFNSWKQSFIVDGDQMLIRRSANYLKEIIRS
jgi:TetR/AcrR family transcriptional repressor of nem operon